MRIVTTVILGILISFSTFGQGANDQAIKVHDGTPEQYTFYLMTTDGNIKLDSLDLQTINPNWIKAINIVKLAEDATIDHMASGVPSTPTVYIKLKRRYLKKYLNE